MLLSAYARPRAVSATARRYGLSSGQLFGWRKLVRKDRLGAGAAPAGFAPAVIVPAPSPACALERAVGAGVMEIVFGSVRILVGADVEETALVRVLAAVARR